MEDEELDLIESSRLLHALRRRCDSFVAAWARQDGPNHMDDGSFFDGETHGLAYLVSLLERDLWAHIESKTKKSRD